MGAPRKPQKPQKKNPHPATRAKAPWLGIAGTAKTKYTMLAKFLEQAPEGPLELTFDDLATLVPGGLPSSAYRHRAWWSNGAADNAHDQAQAWLAAGRTVTSVDLETRRVCFSAVKARPLGR